MTSPGLTTTPLRRLIREVHRRSLWQVLSIYLVGSWGALQVVDGVTENAGLPDWVPPFALVLLVIGLPIVLATAFVQEGMPGSDGGEATHGDRSAQAPPAMGETLGAGPSTPATEAAAGGVQGLFTWRNAILGGAGAASLLGVAVAAYFLMRATGVGPVASLAAQGIFDEREPVILSDFAGTGADAGLARLVTEALRVDLVGSTALTVVPESYLSDALRRMGLADTVAVTADVAREMAVRDGFKAVIRGEVGALGGGYVLTASLMEARSGQDLAAFRETVADESALLTAIDKLSERIREKAGESLLRIRAGESLEAVTTPSLDALKAYTEAQAYSLGGREAEAIALLESALELDPDFGMAWRKLAVLLGNTSADPARQREAATRAYELRGRMGEAERLLAEAYYFSVVEEQPQRAIQAYEQILAVSPDDPTALNNLATRINAREPGRAIELLERAVNGPGATASAHTNLIQYYWDARRDPDAVALIDRTAERYPGTLRAQIVTLNLQSLRGDFAGSHEGRRGLLGGTSLPVAQRFQQELQLAADDAGRGMLAEARGHVQVALDLAEAEDDLAWKASALIGWAFSEALVGSPERARQFMDRHAAVGPPWELDATGGWVVANGVATRALLGDLAGAARAMGTWEAAVSAPRRLESTRAAMAWARWALSLAEDDADEALAAMDFVQDEFLRCGESRCWGWWERGRALESAGRPDEARAMYRRHLDGLAISEALWNPSMTVDALLRLAALAEAAGDAAEAAASYARFAELWSDADPEFQPRVRRAREKATALSPS